MLLEIGVPWLIELVELQGIWFVVLVAILIVQVLTTSSVLLVQIVVVLSAQTLVSQWELQQTLVALGKICPPSPWS